jgi:hypothetical protein
VTINVLVNDSDPDGDTLAISAISNLPLHGTVAINGGRTITYTPTGGFTGADGFTYHIVDGNGGVASALVSITVRPHNAPPVADASATTLQVISPNNSNAIVRLDGTRSSDPDGDTLTYSWYADGSLVPIATGVVADALLEVGEHSIALIVGDGQASDTDTIQLQVITAGEAVEELISTLNQTGISLQIKRPLIATMKAAVAALDRGQSTSGANQLVAFQNKVRAQVGRVDADLARSLIEAAQEIIDALQGH